VRAARREALPGHAPVAPVALGMHVLRRVAQGAAPRVAAKELLIAAPELSGVRALHVLGWRLLLGRAGLVLGECTLLGRELLVLSKRTLLGRESLVLRERTLLLRREGVLGSLL